jgi:preprotein translocase subunit SecY
MIEPRRTQKQGRPHKRGQSRLLPLRLLNIGNLPAIKRILYVLVHIYLFLAATSTGLLGCSKAAFRIPAQTCSKLGS